MKLAPLSSSWRFKSLSLLQTTLKWRIPGAELEAEMGHQKVHVGKGPCLKHHPIQRACARHPE